MRLWWLPLTPENNKAEPNPNPHLYLKPSTTCLLDCSIATPSSNVFQSHLKSNNNEEDLLVFILSAHPILSSTTTPARMAQW